MLPANTTLSLFYNHITISFQNEHILLYLDDIEVPDSAYLPSVYQFIKDCSISVDFTSEEKSKITNTLRSEVCRNGRDYTQTMAWSFFKEYVTLI